MRDQIEKLKSAKPRILVVGDVILDCDRVGEATRISPEAAVPVLLNSETTYRLGGAAAVAAMCVAFGADVKLIGVTGLDREGQTLLQLAEAAGIHAALIAVPDRRTTFKERICGTSSGRHRQQLIRLDSETPTEIPDNISAAITSVISRETFDAAILSDYAKGCVTEQVATACIWNGKTFVDPPLTWDDRGPQWDKFVGCECIVPNRDEACGLNSRKIQRRVSSTASLLKLDSEGCEIYWLDNSHIGHGIAWPAYPVVVRDVTGAGDQTIAALTVGRAAGLNWPESAALAMLSAGLQCERFGCVPVTLKELEESCHHRDRLSHQSLPSSSDLSPAASTCSTPAT